MGFTDWNIKTSNIVGFYVNSTTSNYIDYKPYYVKLYDGSGYEISNYQFVERNSKMYIFWDYSNS